MTAYISPLSSGERDVLEQLFMNGPTQDGDICSKASRCELIEIGYAVRHNGYTAITANGIAEALRMGLDAKKEMRARDRARYFRLAFDEDGHEYVIPEDREQDWQDFLNSPAYHDGEMPDYAHRFEGDFLFAWPIIDGESVVLKERLRAV